MEMALRGKKIEPSWQCNFIINAKKEWVRKNRKIVVFMSMWQNFMLAELEEDEIDSPISWHKLSTKLGTEAIYII